MNGAGKNEPDGTPTHDPGKAPTNDPSSASRRRRHVAFVALALGATVLPLAVLAMLLGGVTLDGLGRIGWDFLTSYPSRRAARAGILPGLVGSISLISLTAALAVPIGVGAAVYLEEYGKRTRIARIIELNIANLAGVPSVIYGLLGLGVFVRTLGMGRSLLAGACTLALLVLPIVIVASREALKNVPDSTREACLALGSTRWQAIRQVVLPMAFPEILTGVILAVSRAIGETAPLVVIGALAYVTFLPDGVLAPFTTLPIQIFDWVSRPQQSFAVNAAAGIVVLMGTLLALNGVAIGLRARLQRRKA
ncbi:MAG: phosphate ABC transporter permease PstA [Deltaproteobacteria bacterium]|nr:phosphate ABC transporter permease PstA [Deltaproteobacteria bacterium]